MKYLPHLIVDGLSLEGFSEPYPFSLNDIEIFKSFEFKNKGGVYVIIKNEVQIVKIGQTNDFSKRMINYLNTNKNHQGAKNVTRLKVRQGLSKESNHTVRFKEIPNERVDLEKLLLCRYNTVNKKLPAMNCNLS